MYRLSNLAARDFETIYEYTLLNFGTGQADVYTEQLDQVMRLLCGSPHVGRECSSIGDGVLRHDHRHHVIFYRVRAEDIFIIRILHSRMEPLRHLGETNGD
ncbi:type II toxin-antitoxin system RelE/ParE family toxin [Endozoicomonas sp. G2_2]|jgi:toxin ParE1/3/4|uniref:type II toxin-antitoxin system RelE/ParE family toxin n=1 Tax=Gammaproteobacteria TaxID=1236 RepID=UPI001ADAC8AA|nr:type II toxin-antitoxin system RelE/ParE family toxin [Endozoicomonas sp. G2_2]MBO9471887.1 type II toxin-antitoxin system RelE/ParE family toxin [Endozoicomonas sp. G2_2]|tara:strand:+ start:1387 stop:1689 length:303 start_codon:yes stop_codon:yes gene_type:complete